MAAADKHIEFTLPEVLKDFVFDLHDATRRSRRIEDAAPLYDTRFRELSEKYFAQSSWPMPDEIASECNNDATFLLFYRYFYIFLHYIQAKHLYRELTLRHLFARLKYAPLELYMDAWSNYVSLFDTILQNADDFITISPQWAFDIVQEYVYQFQAFCQYRTQVVGRSETEIAFLSKESEVWSRKSVEFTLSQLCKLAAKSTSTIHGLIGYFSQIGLARLECLLSDYPAALDASSSISFSSNNELYLQVPAAHVDVYYHVGISLIMSRRYADAMDVLGGLLLHINRLMKPGSIGTVRPAVLSVFQKMLDKTISLVAICMALCPAHRPDEQVTEAVSNKCGEKFRKLNAGEASTFTEMFENSCPKFISGAVPDYSTPSNLCQEAFSSQVYIFTSEVKQCISLLKLATYLKLYASMDINKLAKFMETTPAELTSRLQLYKEKASSKQALDYFLSFRIEGDTLYVEVPETQTRNNTANESFFRTAIRKNQEVATTIDKVFRSNGF